MHKVVAAINKAKKPLICAGGGVILGNGEECVRQFCEKNNIPLVTTMMGIGVMPKNHPLYFGMLGNNGKPYATVQWQTVTSDHCRCADRRPCPFLNRKIWNSRSISSHIEYRYRRDR